MSYIPEMQREEIKRLQKEVDSNLKHIKHLEQKEDKTFWRIFYRYLELFRSLIGTACAVLGTLWTPIFLLKMDSMTKEEHFPWIIMLVLLWLVYLLECSRWFYNRDP